MFSNNHTTHTIPQQIPDPPHTVTTTTTIPTSSSTIPHTQLETPITNITLGYLNRAVHEFSADFKEQYEAEEKRRKIHEDAAKEVTRDEELTFDQLREMMHQIFNDQPHLRNEKPNLYHSLMATYAS
jgi:hypothetical protein